MLKDGNQNMKMGDGNAQPATSVRPPRRLDPRSLLLADNVEYVLAVGDAQRLKLTATIGAGDEETTTTLVSPDLVGSFVIVKLSDNPLQVRGMFSVDPAEG